ncbi:MAG: hypothetical protein HYT80_04440 [Euryarchaeota archaeon]|nr:hypothetical protein [Euryarchaeota archaeon]
MTTPEASPTPDDASKSEPPAPDAPEAPEDASAAPAAASDAVPQNEAPRPKAKGHRKLAIALGSVGGLLVILLGFFLYLLQPVASVGFDDPVDAESRSTNTALYATLLAAGINDPFVDVDEARAYVAYVHPNATANESQQVVYQRFVIGAAADAAPDTRQIHVLMYVGKDPRILWTVAMSDVRAYLRGELDADGFDAKIAKQTF